MLPQIPCPVFEDIDEEIVVEVDENVEVSVSFNQQ